MNVRDHWVEVEYAGTRGWVFGYFLGGINDERFYTITGGKITLHSKAEDTMNNGAVTKIGRLMFTTCALGQDYKDGGCTGQARLFQAGENTGDNTPCKQLSLLQKRWRVPSYAEALKIKGSAVARHAQKNGSGFFWTSTVERTDHEEMWRILDYNTWQDRATFVEAGYMICVSDS